jgi:arsenate reductase-like glutaredoxin family protein
MGARALIDESGSAYRDAGLAWMRLNDADILARLLAEPRLLRLPLVRFGSEVTVGVDEGTWRAWQRRT